MGQIINYTRLTTSDKLDDRFLTCQVYEPVDPEQVKSGMVFSQIEILNPWFPTSQIGQTVINTLIREYYRGTDTSDLVNFENAIKKVNEALAQIAQNGETEWIGKFSGILALVNGEEIHIAQTGQSQAYLFRGSKVNHITEGLGSNEPPHPLKTFTNLTSGNIQEGDKIIIGNSTLFAVYSPTELKIPISSYRPTLSAIEIARGLKRHGAQNGNAIIFELTTKDELANIPPEQKLDTIYLDKGGFDLVSSLRSTGSSIALLFGGIGRGILSLAKSSKKVLGPKIKSSLAASQKGLGSVAQSAAKFGHEAREKISSGNTDSRQDGEARQAEAPSDIPRKGNQAKKYFLKFKNKLRRFLIAIGFYSPKKSKMLATIIYVVVGILVLTVAYTLITRSKRVNDKNLGAKSAQITSLSGDASVATTKGDENLALQKYLEITKLASDIKGTKYENNVKEIIDKAQSRVKEISKLSVVEPGKDYKIEGDISALTSMNDNLLYYKKPDGIFLKKALESSFNILINKELSSTPVSSTPIENENKIALLLSDKKISLINTQDKTAQEQAVKIDGGIKVGEFSGNLYILDPGSNQIWKSVSEDGQYNNASAYIKDETVMSSAVDLSIDGSVYVLNNDCGIIKLSKGAKNTEITTNLPGGQKLQNCKKLSTSETSTGIFIASENDKKIKIVEIKKDGEFVAQFDLNGSNDTKNILINANRREVVVQTGSQIITYKI